MVHRIRRVPWCLPGNGSEGSSSLRAWSLWACGTGFAPGGAKHGRLGPGFVQQELREARDGSGFAALAEREKLGREFRPGQEATAIPRGSSRDPGPALRLRTANGPVPSPPPHGLRRSSRSPGRCPEETGPVRTRLRRRARDRPDPVTRPLVFCSGSVRRQGCEACRCRNRMGCHDQRLGRVPQAADAHSHSQAWAPC